MASARFPNAVIRVAFIGYRDHCDGDQRLDINDFIEIDKVDNLKRKVNANQALYSCM